MNDQAEEPQRLYINTEPAPRGPSALVAAPPFDARVMTDEERLERYLLLALLDEGVGHGVTLKSVIDWSAGRYGVLHIAIESTAPCAKHCVKIGRDSFRRDDAGDFVSAWIRESAQAFAAKQREAL